MPQSRHPWRRLAIVMIAILALVARPGAATAQYYNVYSNAPFTELAGLQQAIQRLYQGEQQVNFYADLARFDTEANAAAGFEALSTYYLETFAATASPLAFEAVEVTSSTPGIVAYRAELDIGSGPYGEAALAQAQDGVATYTVTVLNYAFGTDPTELAVEAAVAMVDAMAAAPDGGGTPEAVDEGEMTGGAWSALPRLADEVPQRYGMTYSEDTEWFALEVATPEAESGDDTSDPSELLYGDAAGLQTVISRSYEPVDGGPEGVDDAYVEIAAFADADSAAAGFANAEAALVEEIAAGGIALEPVEADVDSDTSIAWMGPIEGTDSALAVVVSQAGSYVIAVVIIGDVDADLLGFAEDLSAAVIDAGAGDGAETFDQFGASSGGLWDRLPASGDEVLQGLEAYYDDQLYP